MQRQLLESSYFLAPVAAVLFFELCSATVQNLSQFCLHAGFDIEKWKKRQNPSIDSEPVGQLSTKNTLSPYRAWRKNKTVKYKMSVCPLKVKTMLLIVGPT